MNLLLLDGTHSVFRFYHSVAHITRPSDGAPINALYGVCNSLLGLFKGFRKGYQPAQPTHFGAVFDHGRQQSFRSTMYPAYKAQRPPLPDDIKTQLLLIRDALPHFGIPVISTPGVEADDVMATYARQCAALGGSTVIISNDKDLMQVVNGCVSLYDPIRRCGVAEVDVFTKFGVTPRQVPDVQALIGDIVDNVPGVPGIGPKIAAKLIATHGSLEGVIAAAETLEPARFREPIRRLAITIRMSQELVTLDNEVAVPPIDGLAWALPDGLALGAYLRSIGLETLGREAEMG